MKKNPSRAAVREFTKQFYKGNKLNMALILLTTLGISSISIMLSFILQQIIDMVAQTRDALSFGTIIWMTIGLIVFCIVGGAIDSVFTPRFTSKAMRQYKTYVFDKLMKKSISSFSDENTATYISALSNDANIIEPNYLGSIWKLTEYTVWFVGALGLMLLYSPILTLIAIGVSLLPAVISIITGGKMVNAEKQVSQQNETFIGSLKDALSGFSVIKSFKAEKEVSGLFHKVTHDTENLKRKRDRLQSIIRYSGMIAGVMAQLSVFIIGAALAGEESAITPGVLTAFINLMGMVINPIGEIPSILAKRRSALALIEKMSNALSAHEQKGGEHVPAQLENGIEVKDVSFAYENDQPVLHHVYARFVSGKSYAIVGGSGSGKTTLLNLLMAARTDYQGEILFDGKEVRTIHTESLYEVASQIHQNVFVFDNTIRDNITMFRPFPEEDIQRSIYLSGLSKVIEEKGADYDCGENGSGLSGGERQRISIARALLRKTPVLLVDEATASLDAETAFHVTDSILNLDGLTRIVVTHTLNETLLERYDEILVLKNGYLTEQGTFADLMDKKGYFYSLFTVSQ